MKFGKVIEYDNYVGKIIDENGKTYIFTNEDLNNNKIDVNDYVKFIGEEYKTIEILEYRAHFIKRIINNK